MFRQNLIRTRLVDNLRRIGNPPGREFRIIYGPISNRPQVINLPHIGKIVAARKETKV
jgi:hypothetical protein